MKGRAFTAVSAQAVQALVSFFLQVLVARLLGIEEFGRFAILYGVIVIATAVITGLVGDSLVVLDRVSRRVRAGLEVVLLVTAVCLATFAAIAVFAAGLGSAVESVLFGVALGMFATEEIVRRLLMAHMRYERVILADASGFLVVAAVVAASWWGSVLSLALVLAALGAGQGIACLVGWVLVPREDRFLVGLGGAAWKQVLTYGAWRAMQQVLRPSLFTAVRLLVLALAGVASVGFLEAARTYTSPLALVVGGLSSFLFVRYAGQRSAEMSSALKDADRAVVGLIGLSIVMSVFALLLTPWVTPLLFGVDVDALAVLSWLVYGVSVAVVTPYGALGAVVGRQVAVFLVRLGDTLLAVVIALAMLLWGAPPSSVPLGLAVASAAGGLVLRRFVAAGHEDFVKEM